MYGHLILHTLPASVHRMASNAFKVRKNLTLSVMGTPVMVTPRAVLGEMVSFSNLRASGVPRGVWGVQTPPPPRNSEDIGGVLDRMSKKNRRLDFLL